MRGEAPARAAREPRQTTPPEQDAPAAQSAFRPVPRRADTEARGSYVLRTAPPAEADGAPGPAVRYSGERRLRSAATPRGPAAEPHGGKDQWATVRDVGCGIAVGMVAGGALGLGIGHALWGGAKAGAGTASSTGAGAAKGAAAGGAAAATPAAAQAAAAAMANIQTMTLVGMGTGGGAGGGLGAARAHQRLVLDRPPPHPDAVAPRRRGYSSQGQRLPLSPRPVARDSPRPLQPRPANAATPPVRATGWAPDGGAAADAGPRGGQRAGSSSVRSSSGPSAPRRTASQSVERPPPRSNSDRESSVGLKSSLRGSLSRSSSLGRAPSEPRKNVTFSDSGRSAAAAASRAGSSTRELPPQGRAEGSQKRR
eukprot:TRINITY_DN14132_c0_g1_i1.p2 TRINITY_DN14132_c0_g1~~TRINITY_DN14132_c0_g1_i1.p2  ORF type:complete len:368 (+),score=43.02 TRINITY_DN14132_c0_g1_i1:186-1289(+)